MKILVETHNKIKEISFLNMYRVLGTCVQILSFKLDSSMENKSTEN